MYQDLTTRPQVQETLFSTPAPLFMFDTGTSPFDATAHNSVRGELFNDPASLTAETWNSNQHHHHHQVQAFPHHQATFSIGIDTNNYLPPLIENMIPMDEEGDIALRCMQRQELNSNFLFWDNVDEPLGGEEIAAISSSMEASLSSFPSSL